MEKKTEQLNLEQQLLQARERGLREASQIHAMKAHGKVLGMDTFSWVNPDLNALTTVISSFPFAVHWVGEHEQIQRSLKLHPALVDNLQSLIVYDHELVDVPRELLAAIPNVACLEGTIEALGLLKAMQKEKSVFLFTSSEDEDRQAIFETFIEVHK